MRYSAICKGAGAWVRAFYESFVFPTCGLERPPSARVADQTVERDGRQAMPRAEPALPQVATLRLPAVVGAATLRGRESPHP